MVYECKADEVCLECGKPVIRDKNDEHMILDGYCDCEDIL